MSPSSMGLTVVAAGLSYIVSNQDVWYLDHLDTTWPEFYENEPLTNITNPKQQELVIGGEVCMWGEHIDASDIEQTIWPRAAAAAGNHVFHSKFNFVLKFQFCISIVSSLSYMCRNQLGSAT